MRIGDVRDGIKEFHTWEFRYSTYKIQERGSGQKDSLVWDLLL